MNSFQRIRGVILGVLGILLAAILALLPKESFLLVDIIIGAALLIYGFRMMFYYFLLARHMVGGKQILIHSILILDLALFLLSMMSMASIVIPIYLLGVFVFSGAIDILRAFEAKRYGGAWMNKFIFGCVSIGIALALVTLGLILGKSQFLVYGYALSLVYSSVIRIANAFRKTAIVYIQ